MTNFALCATLLVSLLAPPSADSTDCPPECQLAQVRAYFRALDDVFREGSTVAEIDTLFSLLHDRVRYVHADYDADFQREAWRSAFIRNVERGAYRNGPERRIGIITVIHGKDAVAVAYSHGEVLPDGTWNSGEPLLAMFRFTAGKISLIEELW